jgi:hypothetical protein
MHPNGGDVRKGQKSGMFGHVLTRRCSASSSLFFTLPHAFYGIYKFLAIQHQKLLNLPKLLKTETIYCTLSFQVLKGLLHRFLSLAKSDMMWQKTIRRGATGFFIQFINATLNFINIDRNAVHQRKQINNCHFFAYSYWEMVLKDIRLLLGATSTV